MPESPGAPDSAATAILDAAEELFAAQGYAATTIKQIGAKAGVNPALLYYYHGDKEGLYRAALARVLATVETNATERLAVDDAPDALRALIAFQAQLFSTRPSAARLLMREIVDHRAEHVADAGARFVAVVFERLCQVIRDGQERGRLRDDFRPEFAAVSTISQMVYLALVQPLLGRRLGGEAAVSDPAALLRDFAKHAADFATAAMITNPGAEDQ